MRKGFTLLLTLLMVVNITSSRADQIKTGNDYFKAAPYGSSVVTFGPINATFNQFYGMTGDGKSLTGRSFSLLPACLSNLDTVCIESLDTKKTGETKWERGRLSQIQFNESEIIGHKQPAGNAGDWKYSPFKVDAEGLPYGGIAPIWEMKHNVFPEGNKYVTSFDVEIDNTHKNSPQISIFTTINGIVSDSNFVDAWNGNGPTIYQLPSDVEFRLTVRLGKMSKIISPWLKGHMKQVSVNQDSSKMMISGIPTKVSLLASDYLDCDQLPKVDESGSPLECGNWEFSNRIYDSYNLAFQKDSRYSQGAFPSWENRLKTIGDLSLWFLRTPYALSSKAKWESFNGGKCSDINGLSVISSNATLDSDLPPKWNAIDKSLEFDVVGAHLDFAGKENIGFYSFSMPTGLAKCYWGIDLPINRLEVSITGGDNENPEVLTSSVSASATNFNFNISGFKYSSHKILIRPDTGTGSPISFIDASNEKLDYYEIESDIPSPLSTVKVSSSKKVKTIKCVKGKVLKKITNLSPKCPTGYKLTK